MKIEGILLGKMKKPLLPERLEVTYEYPKRVVTQMGSSFPSLKEPELRGIVEFQNPKRLYTSKGDIKVFFWIKSRVWLKRIFGIKELATMKIKNCCFKRKNSKTIGFYKGKEIK